MHSDRKHSVFRRVAAWESAAFGCIILLIWLDEIIDVPALLLGAPTTPVNWRESLFESGVIALLWAAVIRLTNKLFQRMRYLEGLLPVCAACKRIRWLAGAGGVHSGPLGRRIHPRHLPGLRRAALS